MTLAVTTTGALEWPLRDVTGTEAIKARARSALQTIQGERPEDVSIGLPAAWVEGVAVTPTQAEAVLRSQLRRITDVESVTTVGITDGATGRTITATVVASTVDGLTRLTIGAPLPYDTRGVPAWYMTSGTLPYGRGPAWTGP